MLLNVDKKINLQLLSFIEQVKHVVHSLIVYHWSLNFLFIGSKKSKMKLIYFQDRNGNIHVLKKVGI